jgi:hypothetical protein
MVSALMLMRTRLFGSRFIALVHCIAHRTPHPISRRDLEHGWMDRSDTALDGRERRASRKNSGTVAGTLDRVGVGRFVENRDLAKLAFTVINRALQISHRHC